MDNRIEIHGNVYNSQIAQTLSHCSLMVQTVPPGGKKDELELLEKQIAEVIAALPDDKAKAKTAKNLDTLIEQVVSEEPDRDWYSVSSKGLLEAAQWTNKFSAEIFSTIGNIGKVFWPDFTPPEVMPKK